MPLFLFLSLLLFCGGLEAAQIRKSDAEALPHFFKTSAFSSQFYLDHVAPTDDEKIVRISTGPVLGRRLRTQWKNSAIAFYGIPYAEAAEFDLRFRAPQPKKSWAPRIYDAREKKAACATDPMLTYKNDIGGPVSEDCFHVYVYASPQCIDKGGCPVLAVVHGGKFNFESPVVFPDDVAIDNFVSRDIIVVFIGFRLGPFGWLNLGPGISESSAQKNLGFHDILSGLRWIQREIGSFGGDSRRVTLMGHSSGACLVDTLSLSPRARGLFSQLIIASAFMLLSDSEINQNVNVEASWAVARYAGCAPFPAIPYNGTDEDRSRFSREQLDETLRCLRSVPFKNIVDAQRALYDRVEDFYGPAIDGDILTASNIELLEKRPLYPTLMGTVNAESRIARYILKDHDTPDLALLEEYCNIVGYSLWFENKDTVAKACFDRYKQGKDALYLTEDVGLFTPAIVTANSLAKDGNKVFVYHYIYNGSGGAFDNRWDQPAEDRPSHSEEYIYVLGLHRGPFTPKDWAIQKVFSKIFADFVSSGDPTPIGRAWPEYSVERREHFVIDFPDEKVSEESMPGSAVEYSARAHDFWMEHVQGRLAGRHTLIEKYPEGFDAFQVENLSQILKSVAQNKSSHHDKTEEAIAIGYERWSEWLKEQRAMHLVESPYREIPVVREEIGDKPIGDLTVREVGSAINSAFEKHVAEINTAELAPSWFVEKIIIIIGVALAVYGLYALVVASISRRKKADYIPFK